MECSLSVEAELPRLFRCVLLFVLACKTGSRCLQMDPSPSHFLLQHTTNQQGKVGVSYFPDPLPPHPQSWILRSSSPRESRSTPWPQRMVSPRRLPRCHG